MNVKVSVNKTTIPVPSAIKCVLDIPQTDYVKERQDVFNGEKECFTFYLPPLLLYAAKLMNRNPSTSV